MPDAQIERDLRTLSAWGDFLYKLFREMRVDPHDPGGAAALADAAGDFRKMLDTRAGRVVLGSNSNKEK